MDQFSFMVDYLDDCMSKQWRNMLNEAEQLENESLAFVESIMLNGYNITDVRAYKTVTKKVTELVR
jgi:endonuclease V-like protein UPF0215 family